MKNNKSDIFDLIKLPHLHEKGSMNSAWVKQIIKLIY